MTHFTKKLLVVFAGIFLFVASCQQEKEVPILQDDIVASFSEIIPGQYIVVFNEDKIENARLKFPNDYFQSQQFIRQEIQQLVSQNVVLSAEILHVYSRTIQGAALKLSVGDVKKLGKDSRVAYIEPDRIITLAQGNRPGGGGGTSAGQETPWGITRVNGGETYTGTKVAWVIDTGIDLDHPDLNVVTHSDSVFNAFTTGKDSKSVDDGNGHGTHVAGTIAAINNGIGVVGVAAGAKVVPVKVLDSRGSGSYSGVIAGVDHVARMGGIGDVANMSLGGSASTALDNAVIAASNKGIIFCLAAGNSSADANNYSPARANGTNIYTISAHNIDDVFASFSNYGNPPIDYCAPGVSIKSTWKDGGYHTISGTSMAAPHAAGVLLLGKAKSRGEVNGDTKDDTPDLLITH
jgi:subtilisin family serine protease